MHLSRPRIHAFLLLAMSHTANTALPAIAGADRARNEPNPLQLTIRIYDQVGISGRTLSRSIEIAQKIYSGIGIQTTWIECSERIGQQRDSACLGRPSASPIRVRLHHAADAAKLSAPAKAAGYAIPDGANGFGSTILLFYERISHLSRQTSVSEEILLGHMFAHEIGHLLLGRDSHAASGIMRAPWRRKELRAAATGSLSFGSNERRHLRASTKARHRAQD